MSDKRPIDQELEAWMIAKAERMAKLYPELQGSGLQPTFVAFDEDKGEQK